MAPEFVSLPLGETKYAGLAKEVGTTVGLPLPLLCPQPYKEKTRKNEINKATDRFLNIIFIFRASNLCALKSVEQTPHQFFQILVTVFHLCKNNRKIAVCKAATREWQVMADCGSPLSVFHRRKAVRLSLNNSPQFILVFA
jgi:hypothetical protein